MNLKPLIAKQTTYDKFSLYHVLPVDAFEPSMAPYIFSATLKSTEQLFETMFVLFGQVVCRWNSLNEQFLLQKVDWYYWKVKKIINTDQRKYFTYETV